MIEGNPSITDLPMGKEKNGTRLVEVFKYSSNKLRNIESLIAGILYEIKVASGSRMSMKQCLECAKMTLLLSDMTLTKKAMQEKKLDQRMLDVSDEGFITTVGRFGEDTVNKLFGVDSLPVLMKKTRMAKLYMILAHAGEDNLNHRSAQDMHARSKSMVWIHQGRALAEKVVDNYPICKREKAKLQEQRISRVPLEILKPCPPFTRIAID